MAHESSRPNIFAGRHFDRVAQHRKDDAWIRQALRSDRSLVLPISRARPLLDWAGGPSAVLLPPESIDAHLDDSDKLILLGEYRGSICFAWNTSHLSDDLFEEFGEFGDLRLAGSMLADDEAALLALARALVLWHHSHRFCGRCGKPTRITEAGHVLNCSNPNCERHQFPRIDPAIIVLVADDERCLLGRQPSWPAHYYSTVAGFLEPGESLEDAVVREVYEETGIMATNPRYQSSQPWPFPSSLMLGFTATPISEDISLVDDELEDAQWFDREKIISGKIKLPPPVSISFRLIQEWFDRGTFGALRDVVKSTTRSPRQG